MISSRTSKLVACAGMVFCAPVLLAGDMTVEGNVTATGFSGSGTGLTGVVKTEVDPTVGALTADKWCKVSAGGSVINCDQDAPQKPVTFQMWVPKTGQVFCWDENGIRRDCENTGEDGEYRMGGRYDVSPSHKRDWFPAFRVSPRFRDNNDGTVTDNMTGLIWLKNPNCIGSNPGFDNDETLDDGKVTWQHGLDFVRGMNTGLYDCGDTSNGGSSQTDWRMPNYNELISVTDGGRRHPTPDLDPDHPFTGVKLDGFYWSSTSIDGAERNAEIVDLKYWGTIIGYDGKKSVMYLWPVRGGE